MSEHFASEIMRDRYVCWSKMGVEAGQHLEQIYARKEWERVTGEGVFMWGVGNAPSTAVKSFVAEKENVPLVFSKMLSKPKFADSRPESLCVWRCYIDHEGREQEIPSNVLLTSRAVVRNGSSLKPHYALICYSADRLELGDRGSFDPSCFRNVSGNRRKVGASQVTALLERTEEKQSNSKYRVNMMAELTGSLWVKLSNPKIMSSLDRKRYDQWANRCDLFKHLDWLDWVAEMRAG